MLAEPPDNWFVEQIKEFEKDPKFQAECAMMDVTERICEMHGQPRGIYKILFLIMTWCADKLIWRADTKVILQNQGDTAKNGV